MKYKQILLTRPPTGSNALQGGSDADPHPQPPLGLAYLAGVLERLPDVNVLDILAVVDAWGPCESNCQADLDGDLQVNVVDLLLVIASW